MVAVDGTDALAYVIIRPNKTGDGVILEAAASGLSKPTAARVLRHIADQWDPPDRAEGSSFANRREEGGTG
jgi:hypothetical protein